MLDEIKNDFPVHWASSSRVGIAAVHVLCLSRAAAGYGKLEFAISVYIACTTGKDSARYFESFVRTEGTYCVFLSFPKMMIVCGEKEPVIQGIATLDGRNGCYLGEITP